MWKLCVSLLMLVAAANCDEVDELKKEVEILRNELSLHRAAEKEHLQHMKTWTKHKIIAMRDQINAIGQQNSVTPDDGQNLLSLVNSAVQKALAAARQSEHQNHRQTISDLDSQLKETREQTRRLKTELSKMKKEMKAMKTSNSTDGIRRCDCTREHPRLRHLRVMHHRLSDVLRWRRRAQAEQEETKRAVQQVKEQLDTSSQEVKILEEEATEHRERLANLTDQVGDSDKLHESMLELLENLQNIEEKVDKTLPEFRKEISKLGANMAQVNSHISYNREDTENLRQSVKAIAFSVSNAIDKAEVDRAVLHHLNFSVASLQALSKQHSYRLYDHMLKSEANNTRNKTTRVVEGFDPFEALPELISEVQDLRPAHVEYEELVSHLPRDCSEVHGPPGKYMITPAPGTAPVDAWCNNGTTLLQRRFDGSVEFNLNFAGYTKSFGKPDGEYWIGLENMHRLSADNCSGMRIDMKDIYGGGWYASYDTFFVGSADSGYNLYVEGFSGNASDAFEYQNRMEFSAVDRDRDISNTHCAANYEGGFWFSHCQHVNINGKYTLGLTWFDSVRNEWIAVASSEMKLTRREGCVPKETTTRPTSVI